MGGIEMKEHKHLGCYGLVVKDGKILLIKKKTGPYDGLLDLPGGSFEFGETPEETLKREMLEETGLEITKYQLFDASSVVVEWKYDDNTNILVHHIGIFYQILEYQNEIRKDISIDNQNDDSLGAEFYEIKNLKKEDVSAIALMELEKLGYSLD